MSKPIIESFMRPTHEPPETERRVSVRYACEGETLCHLGGGRRRGRHECLRGLVQDVSASGVGLRLEEDIRPGTRLALEFAEGNTDSGRILRARVVHCTLLDDGTWLVGCRFEAPADGQAGASGTV
jgi:hypothetical protein